MWLFSVSSPTHNFLWGVGSSICPFWPNQSKPFTYSKNAHYWLSSFFQNVFRLHKFTSGVGSCCPTCLRDIVHSASLWTNSVLVFSCWGWTRSVTRPPSPSRRRWSWRCFRSASYSRSVSRGTTLVMPRIESRFRKNFWVVFLQKHIFHKVGRRYS